MVLIKMYGTIEESLKKRYNPKIIFSVFKHKHNNWFKKDTREESVWLFKQFKSAKLYPYVCYC